MAIYGVYGRERTGLHVTGEAEILTRSTSSGERIAALLINLLQSGPVFTILSAVVVTSTREYDPGRKPILPGAPYWYNN